MTFFVVGVAAAVVGHGMNFVLSSIQRFRQRHIIDPNKHRSKSYFKKVRSLSTLPNPHSSHPAISSTIPPDPSMLPPKPEEVPIWKVKMMRLGEVAFIAVLTCVVVVVLPTLPGLDKCTKLSVPLNHIERSLPQCYFGVSEHGEGVHGGEVATSSSEALGKSQGSNSTLETSTTETSAAAAASTTTSHASSGGHRRKRKRAAEADSTKKSGSSSNSKVYKGPLEITCENLKGCMDTIKDEGICYPSKVEKQFIQTLSAKYDLMCLSKNTTLASATPDPLVFVLDTHKTTIHLVMNEEEECYYESKSLFWATPEHQLKLLLVRGMYNIWSWNYLLLFGGEYGDAFRFFVDLEF
jgi:hypothetical protein